MTCAIFHAPVYPGSSKSYKYSNRTDYTGLFKNKSALKKFILQEQIEHIYGDVLYVGWSGKSQIYFHTLQALDVSPTCDAADVKSIIQLFTLVAACHR
jgi:hypothetical protein